MQIRLQSCFDASAPPRVDRAARRINGIAVMTVGEAKGHSFRLNEISLANALALGSAAAKGVKSRLSHPSACNDATGKHLGRSLNFRQSGDKLLADLQLSAAASKSPHGNLSDYVLTLAEEDPEAFGMSMVVEYQLETELDAKKQPKLDANDKPLAPFAIITALKAVDVVGDPAANPGGLFSEDTDTDFATSASALLDSVEAGSPEALLSRAEVFLRSYLSHRFGEDADLKFEISKGPRMTAEQQTRANDFAALCTKYLGDNAETKTKAAAFAADDKATLDSVKDSLLGELRLAALGRPEETSADGGQPTLAAYKARQIEITALCVSALGDNLDARKRADVFLADATITGEAVRNAMFAEVCAKLKAPAAGDDQQTAGGKTDDKRKAELAAEYDAHASTHAQLGISRDDYVKNTLAQGDSPIVVIAPKMNA